MIRRSTLLWLLAAILVGSGLYQLKYEVQAKEERLARLNRQIQQEQEAIHVLHAEWAFLNRPDRLADLANRHLEMTPVAPAQFGKVATIPERSLIEDAGAGRKGAFVGAAQARSEGAGPGTADAGGRGQAHARHGRRGSSARSRPGQAGRARRRRGRRRNPARPRASLSGGP
jgi:hypothetical protein